MNRMPESLSQQLHAAQRRLWAVETAMATLGGVCGLLLSYLLLFVSDRFWETPALVRFLCTAGGVTGAALGAWWWASHLRRRRDPRATARLVQKRYPRLGDRLLSVVELSGQERLPANVSASLLDAAMRQVAQEGSALNFGAAVPTRWLRRWTPAGIVAACLTTAALALMPAAGLNAFKRWARPIADEKRYTFTQIEPLTGKRVVAYGETFQVDAKLAAGTKRRPAEGSARVERQSPVEAALKGDQYSFELPGQTRPGRLSVAVGDAREGAEIEPMFRPDLSALTALIELPAYLQYPAVKTDARKGTLEVLEGSQVSFEGRVGRRLEEATVTGRDTRKLTVNGAEFRSPILALDDLTALKFTWRDEVGLSCRTPFELKVAQRSDEPPQVECRGLDRATAVLEDETLVFRVEAEDDFGVKRIGLKWEVVDAAPTAPAASATPPAPGASPAPGTPAAGMSRGASELAAGKPQDRQLGAETRFSPRALGIGPGRVTLRAMASDYKPGRPESESAPYTILVLDRAQHAKLVQQMLDKLAQQIEEIARTEQQQVETTQRLREELAKLLDQAPNAKARQALEKEIQDLKDKLAASKAKTPRDEKEVGDLEKQLAQKQDELAKLGEDDAQKQLDKLADQLNDAKLQEQANKERAQKASEDLQKLGKEALRNDQLASEALKEMAKLMEMLQQLAKGEMQQAQQALQNAQNAGQQSQQGQRSDQMQEAQKQQAEAAKRLQEIARQMQRAGEQLLAETFVNRLKATARNEKEVGAELTSVAPRTVGATLAQLPPELRQRLQLQEQKQKLTQKKVKDIKDDMNFFLRRQVMQELHDVHQEMDKVNVVEELGRVAGLINNNLAAQAIEQTGKWEKKLLAWAETLKKSRDRDGGGGGGGGQQPPPVPEWLMELVLRIARVRAQEEGLREQTRAVEERRPADEKYAERAKDLTDRQDGLLTQFDKIPEEVQLPTAVQMRLSPLWEAVDKAMADAIVLLRKPDTGGNAIAAQTEVIELLGNLMQESSKGGGGGGGQMTPQQTAMMQQMMQMMGSGSGGGGGGSGGSGGGGNPNGGGTDQASGRAAGRGDGTSAADRRLDHAGGRDMASLPVEFRDALEGYYNAVDAKR
jgi:hypothetical protein